MTGLKPCPFCGGEANIYLKFPWSIFGWIAVCTDCGASIDYSKTEEEAIEVWNRRTDNE